MSESTDGRAEERRGGLGEFLRTLLSGIPWSERAEATETVELEAPASGALRIDNANGRTALIGEDRGDIEVRLHKHARAESEEEARSLLGRIHAITRDTADHLLIEFDIPRRWNRRGRVDAELRVPRDLRVEVMAANGRICLSGLRASLRAKSSNGAIRVEDVVGDVFLHTSNAKISAQRIRGKLMARSSNGKIQLDDHEGSVDAATSNGTICACLEDLGREGIVLATSNGRIALELPEKVDGDVDIRVDNGVIRNHRQIAGSSRERSGRLKGTLGRGGAPIKLRASNGSVSLR